MRVLLVSNAGWAPSGYGTAVESLAPRLRNAGHEIAVSAFFGLQGGQVEWKGIHHYPAGFKPYGRDVIPLHARDFAADIVVTLIDVWVLDPKLNEYVRFCPWAPIDHKPVPPRVAGYLEKAFAVFSWTKYAVDELEKVGIRSYYIPLGIETDIFQPMDNPKEARSIFGIPEDAFVIGMVAANQAKYPTRKGFERIMPAVRSLIDQGYDDLVLYLHTLPTPDIGGVDLLQAIRTFKLEDHVYLPRPDIYPMGGMSREDLALLYNAFDLYAMPSNSEGFGLPLVEAQSCGVPAIATNFTSMPELCASGWLIDVATTYLSPLQAWQSLASIDSIKERITYAYNNRDELKQKGKEAHQFAKQYSWDKIIEDNWVPTLNELSDKIDRSKKHAAPDISNMPTERIDNGN